MPLYETHLRHGLAGRCYDGSENRGSEKYRSENRGSENYADYEQEQDDDDRGRHSLGMSGT